MTPEVFFAVVLLLAIVASALDVMFGKTMRKRRLLHAAIVVLYILALLTVPRCSSKQSGPDVELKSPPYTF